MVLSHNQVGEGGNSETFRETVRICPHKGFPSSSEFRHCTLNVDWVTRFKGERERGERGERGERERERRIFAPFFLPRASCGMETTSGTTIKSSSVFLREMHFFRCLLLATSLVYGTPPVNPITLLRRPKCRAFPLSPALLLKEKAAATVTAAIATQRHFRALFSIINLPLSN